MESGGPSEPYGLWVVCFLSPLPVPAAEWDVPFQLDLSKMLAFHVTGRANGLFLRACVLHGHHGPLKLPLGSTQIRCACFHSELLSEAL